MNISTLLGVEFRPITIPESIHRTRRRRLHRDGRRAQPRLPRDLAATTTTPSPPPNCSPSISRTRTSCGSCGSSSATARRSAASASTFRSRRARRPLSGSSNCSPKSQGQGLGTAGYALVEQTAREHGRTVLQSWAEHPAGPGPVIVPPTGFGSIPEDRAARFYCGERLRARAGRARQRARPPRRSTDTLENAARRGPGRVDGLPGRAVVAAHSGRVRRRLRVDEVAHVDGRTGRRPRVRRGDLGCRAPRHATTRCTPTPAACMLVTAAQHIETGALCAFNELVIGTGPRPRHPIRRTRSC